MARAGENGSGGKRVSQAGGLTEITGVGAQRRPPEKGRWEGAPWKGARACADRSNRRQFIAPAMRKAKRSAAASLGAVLASLRDAARPRAGPGVSATLRPPANFWHPFGMRQPCAGRRRLTSRRFTVISEVTEINE